ncbi:hypothetical protein KP509_26G049700 [Ceratopteris richardii]|nr:hypothetical protein KP509_26G049700 [Ceratopteris richardii]
MVMGVFSRVAHADCEVQNKSGKKIIAVPVDIDVDIVIDIGAVVSLPLSKQKCYFKNPESGNKKGPFELKDGGIYVIVDGLVHGTVDIYLGGLVLGILQLIVKICIAL